MIESLYIRREKGDGMIENREVEEVE